MQPKIFLFSGEPNCFGNITIFHNTPGIGGDHSGCNDKFVKAEVVSGTWQLFEHDGYQGQDLVIGPGIHDLGWMTFKLSSLKAFEGSNDRVNEVRIRRRSNGGQFSHRTLTWEIPDLGGAYSGFNDMWDLRVLSGRWRFYEHINYGGIYHDYIVGDKVPNKFLGFYSSAKPV